MARALLARGVTKETRIGLLATNRPEWVSAALGIALTGATCVCLSTFASASELEYQLRVGGRCIPDFRALGAEARICR